MTCVVATGRLPSFQGYEPLDGSRLRCLKYGMRRRFEEGELRSPAGGVVPGAKRVLGDPKRLAQLLGICEALPEVDISGDQHLAFRIRNKTFAYYLDDHHG